jgi:hypothetical protein
VILPVILESRGREAARTRAHDSIACGLAAQLVMRAGPSRAFDGIARGTGSHGAGGQLHVCLSQFGWTVRSR